jgi:hypothetical protein
MCSRHSARFQTRAAQNPLILPTDLKKEAEALRPANPSIPGKRSASAFLQNPLDANLVLGNSEVLKFFRGLLSP